MLIHAGAYIYIIYRLSVLFSQRRRLQKVSRGFILYSMYSMSNVNSEELYDIIFSSERD